MGILPLQFKEGESAETFGLKGAEQFSILLSEDIQVGQEADVVSSGSHKFSVKVRLDTQPEITYYKNGGILPYVLRKLLQ